MKQTLRAAAKKISLESIPVENLLVLSETAKRESLLEHLKEEDSLKYSDTISKEVTYQDYIWNFCIDNEFKEVEKTIEIDFYTEQELKDEDGNEFSAINKLVESLETKSDYISHLLIGSGGMGKSSLCLSLINRLADNNKNIPFLISSEEIRKYCEENNYNPHVANDVFDLYEIQAKCNQHLNILDRKKFELALLSGSLTIIIDGLDEFPSILGEKFDTRRFLESISSIHSELGKSRILITSRENNLLGDDEIEHLNINKFELLGFQEKDCIRYVRKRFKETYNLDELQIISTDIVNKVKETPFYENGRIVPFFIDVICNIYEEHDDLQSINLSSSQEIPYKCLNNVTDGIIYSIFEREKFRHSIPISSHDMFDIFCYFSATHGKRWDIGAVDQYVSMMYGEEKKYESILNAVLINPLLLRNNDDLELKYDFTLSYFNSIYIIESVTGESALPEFIDLLAKTSFESTSFYDLKEYLNKHGLEVLEITRSIIKKIEDNKRNDDCAYSKAKNIAAIEFLFYLSVMHLKNPDKNKATEAFKFIYGRGVKDSIHKSYVKGDLPPIDFRSLSVSNSRFSDYPNFLNSDFSNSSFIYTVFERCFNKNINNKGFLEADIDHNSCELGNLQEAISIIDEKNRLDNDKLIQECRKFLGSFLRGQSYRDNNEAHIRFSISVKALQRTEFKKIIRRGFIVLNADKEIDKFYALSPQFKKSARRFVLNGTKDPQVKDFIRFVSNEA
ncbi:NACHT domain-containing protein [Vibrio alginolyticus]|nr:NACHT domain-containing protein [Vibrio alginolyticus]